MGRSPDISCSTPPNLDPRDRSRLRRHRFLALASELAWNATSRPRATYSAVGGRPSFAPNRALAQVAGHMPCDLFICGTLQISPQGNSSTATRAASRASAARRTCSPTHAVVPTIVCLAARPARKLGETLRAQARGAGCKPVQPNGAPGALSKFGRVRPRGVGGSHCRGDDLWVTSHACNTDVVDCQPLL